MKNYITLIIAACAALAGMAQTTPADSASLYMPLIFDSYSVADSTTTQPDAQSPYNLDDGAQWLRDAQTRTQRYKALRNRFMVDNPNMVPYNSSTLPEPPKEYAIKADPTKALLTVAPPVNVKPDEKPIEEPQVKLRNWLHTFNGSINFTQAYISGNWYQGGENNMNVLGDVEWKCNLNQDVNTKWMFNNTARYKLGVSTAHGDSLRNYMVNEDNFLFTSQLGYKAMKHWYYSATLNFKTQFFNTYKTNTQTMKAAFLSPGELNVGLGMTFSGKSAHNERTFNLAIAPLSYNMKICHDIVNLNPTSFGIDAGHHTKHSFGSNIEAKWVINFTPTISWSSRLYTFTDYDYIQGDWENTFTFSITRHLNTKIYAHLRYDDSRDLDDKWKHWQFKEILSFGLSYRFANN